MVALNVPLDSLGHTKMGTGFKVLTERLEKHGLETTEGVRSALLCRENKGFFHFDFFKLNKVFS